MIKNSTSIQNPEIAQKFIAKAKAQSKAGQKQAAKDSLVNGSALYPAKMDKTFKKNLQNGATLFPAEKAVKTISQDQILEDSIKTRDGYRGVKLSTTILLAAKTVLNKLSSLIGVAFGSIKQVALAPVVALKNVFAKRADAKLNRFLTANLPSQEALDFVSESNVKLDEKNTREALKEVASQGLVKETAAAMNAALEAKLQKKQSAKITKDLFSELPSDTESLSGSESEIKLVQFTDASEEISVPVLNYAN